MKTTLGLLGEHIDTWAFLSMQYKILKPTSRKAFAKPFKMRVSQLKIPSALDASPPTSGTGNCTNEVTDTAETILAVNAQMSTTENKTEIQSLKDKVFRIERLLRSIENSQRRLALKPITPKQKTPRVKFHNTAVVCRIADDFTQGLEHEADEEVNFMPKGKCRRPHHHPRRAEPEAEPYDFSWPDLDFWDLSPWVIDLEN